MSSYNDDDTYLSMIQLKDPGQLDIATKLSNVLISRNHINAAPAGHNQQYPGPGGLRARSFPTAGFDRANPPQPNSRQRLGNPATKAIRPGNPPIRIFGNPPIRKPVPDSDGEKDYFTFEPTEPSIPPRSPARFPPNALEDAISHRRSSHIDGLHPERPPPQPPITLSSRLPPSYPISRVNSDKTNSPRTSPGSSRKEDNMMGLMAVSHLKTRPGNRSTDSSSSASSEELTQNPTGETFVSVKEGRFLPNFGCRPKRPISSSLMPPLVSPTASAENVEDQHWYRDMTRKQAQRYLERYKENGLFIVRNRRDHYHKYALTLWANGKFYNFVVSQRSDGAYALGSEKTGEHSFESVVKLIEYHQKNLLVLAEGEGSVKLVPLPQWSV